MYRQTSSFCELQKLPDDNETRNYGTTNDEQAFTKTEKSKDISVNLSLESSDENTYTNPGFIEDSQIIQGNVLSQKNVPTLKNSSCLKECEPDNDEEKNNIQNFKNNFLGWCKAHSRQIKFSIKVFCVILYNIYLGVAAYLTGSESSSYCHGVRFLFIITLIVYSVALYKFCVKRFILRPLLNSLQPLFKRLSSFKHTKKIIWTLIWTAVGIFLIIDSASNRYRLVSACGLVCLIALGYVFSAFRRKIVWHHVQCGVIIQFLLSLLILRWNVGREIFMCMGDKIKVLLEYTDQGSSFVFGYLVRGEHDLQTPIFAFKVLPVVIFFSFLVSILYYYGVMQTFIVEVGWLLQQTIGTTACESINAAGSIFLGMSESPLIIRPYLSLMTKSELHAVLTGGFATIAGSVMAAYINFGVSASHLLSASVMSAPAALAFSKLMYPEVEISVTKAENIKIEKGKEKSALEAASNGVLAAIPLVVQIAANLIAFVAFIGLLNGLLSWIGSLVKCEFLTFEWLMSKLFVPLSLIMGVELKDAENVAQLIGLKTIVNEFIAYRKLADFQKAKLLSARSEAIATFALCGFSNIGSIGIQLAVMGSMAPDRKSDLASLAVRAMISGSAACFMTACIAGTLLTDFD